MLRTNQRQILKRAQNILYNSLVTIHIIKPVKNFDKNEKVKVKRKSSSI